MAVKIPLDFDYKKIKLDLLETAVRDKYNVNVENWVKFRHRITATVSSNSLKSSLPISTEVKIAFVELSKSHYEVVTMLGAAKISVINLIESNAKNPLVFKKSFKEFYMHAGSIIDNLARLIYIVNIPNGATAPGRFRFKRHEIGYGSLKNIYASNTRELKGYAHIVKSRVINEIKTIRNNLTHSWPPAMFLDENTAQYLWPVAMRKKEQYYLWPHDPHEIKRIKKEYRKRIPLIEMVTDDWNNIEKFQNDVFKKLTKDIKKYEINYNLKII